MFNVHHDTRYQPPPIKGGAIPFKGDLVSGAARDVIKGRGIQPLPRRRLVVIDIQ